MRKKFNSRNDVDSGAVAWQISRRRWLSAAACGAASTWLASAALAGDTVKNADACTLGFSTYGMKTLTTEEALRALADIGFDAVEIAVRSDWDADSARLSPSRRKSLRSQLQDSGLKLTSLMEFLHPVDDKKQQAALERLKLAAELAHELDPDQPPLVQTTLGEGEWQRDKERLRDDLGAWAELAAATKTTIAIKPHRGGIVSQPAEAVWLFKQLDAPPRLRMVYDYSHYAFRQLPLDETIRTALPWTAHVAIKDAAEKNGNVTFELPGKAGSIDYAAILRAFYAGGYRGDFSCEVSGMLSSKSQYDPIAAAKWCYDHVAGAFREAEVPRAGGTSTQ